MRGQMLAYISVITTSGILNLYLFLYVFHKRDIYKSMSSYFLAYVAVNVIYCLGSAFSMLSTNLPQLKFWTAIMYIGLPFTGPFGFFFVVKYLGFRLQKWHIISLMTIPTITSLLVMTNKYHHLYYRVFTIHPTLGAPFFYQEVGFWYLLQAILTFACMFLGFLLLVSRYKEVSIQYRFQIAALAFGQFLPIFTGAIYLFGITPEGIDPVPMVLWISSLIYFWAISSSKMLSLLPVAKDVIFNSIDDAVMVLDESSKLVEINQASKIHFPLLRQEMFGMKISHVWKALFETSFDMKMGTSEIKVSLEDERIYRVRLSTLDPKRNMAGYLLIFTDITELKNLQKLLEHQAYYDELTHIYNRRAFLQQCEIDYEESIEEKIPLSIMIMDVDHFKRVNDVYGHHMGDRLLEHIVAVCQENLLHGELFARYGGEEFVFSIKNCRQSQAEILADRIRQAVEQTPLIISDEKISITLSIGIFESTNEVGETVSDLLNKADKALYHAKKAGRNRVHVYSKDTLDLDSSDLKNSSNPLMI